MIFPSAFLKHRFYKVSKNLISHTMCDYQILFNEKLTHELAVFFFDASCLPVSNISLEIVPLNTTISH